MTADRIRSAIKAEPFRPFTLHVSDGRSFRVPHPEYVALSPQGRIVIVFEPVAQGQDESPMSILDLLHVTSVDFGEHNGTANPRA